MNKKSQINFMKYIDQIVTKIDYSIKEMDSFDVPIKERVIDGYKEDKTLLKSTDWVTFKFTQTSAKWIYENFSYETATDLLNYATVCGLDTEVDYPSLFLDLDSDLDLD